MIQVEGLTKRYGAKAAVDGLTFTVQPGTMTGFLGPNGSGKSTTMRLMLGLDAPSEGSATVNGKRYAEHAAPLHEVGALLDAGAVHPGRSAYNHLLALAQTQGVPRSRVEELIDLVGLGEVAKTRVGQFSLWLGTLAFCERRRLLGADRDCCSSSDSIAPGRGTRTLAWLCKQQAQDVWSRAVGLGKAVSPLSDAPDPPRSPPGRNRRVCVVAGW